MCYITAPLKSTGTISYLGLPKLTDAWVQTYVEVQEVGIQVGPEDFCSWCKNWRSECNHSAMRRGEENSAQRQNYQYQRAPLDDEDDGYNGSSNNTDDDRDEDVKTIHISATSTRLERRKTSNTGNNIYIYIAFFNSRYYTLFVVL